ncbi:hypothetical protein ACGF3G_00710 [Streptomyces sp. NPDC048179]|uniref:hypothetical protein n=1 Tax=Streptomyces sp. NPDC048179 TaxID=3365506 RepID=UPI0037210C96
MTSKSRKPPLPVAQFHDWPRIPVNTAEGSRHDQMTSIGRRVATDWVLGPEGPYNRREQTMAQTIRGAVSAALLHLMELGLIDVDTARLDAAPGIPWGFNDCRPDRPDVIPPTKAVDDTPESAHA